MIVFKIDGKDFTSLGIAKYTIGTEILDGEASGRTAATGWPMFRQPQGVIKNLALELSPADSKNQLFLDFINVLDSFGDTDFRQVYFKAPGQEINQKMYAGGSYSLDVLRIDQDGTQHYAALQIQLIAERGQ